MDEFTQLALIGAGAVAFGVLGTAILFYPPAAAAIGLALLAAWQLWERNRQRELV